jgi:Spy/CpxP family protein refolding chaperone
MYTTMRWWRLAGCEPSFAGIGRGACGASPRGYAMEMRGHGHGPGSGSRGVRRPLRFLAWKLELDDEQLGEVAKILSELKTEDAQGEVDRAKRLAAFADAVSAEAFDATRAGEGAALRVASAERMRSASLKALERLHAVLDAEQRRTLAYLSRTGSISF